MGIQSNISGIRAGAVLAAIGTIGILAYLDNKGIIKRTASLSLCVLASFPFFLLVRKFSRSNAEFGRTKTDQEIPQSFLKSQTTIWEKRVDQESTTPEIKKLLKDWRASFLQVYVSDYDFILNAWAFLISGVAGDLKTSFDSLVTKIFPDGKTLLTEKEKKEMREIFFRFAKALRSLD